MEFMQKFWRKLNQRELILLGIILLFGAWLRLVNLDRADMLSDPAINAFRAIGLTDFLTSPTQTTPMQWFDTKQWWQNLSFHDHPILTFLTEHIFFKAFGVSVTVARLPFALLGALSIWLIYLLASRVFNKQIGLLSAGLLAVVNFHVWLSRSGYLESFVIVFILLSLFFAYQARKERKHLYWAALFLGLGLLSKYTIMFIIPSLIIWWLIYDRKIFVNKHFYLSIALLLLVISPIIIYNLNMFWTRGHFDAALSSMVGQTPDDFKLLQRSLASDYLGNILLQLKELSRIFSPASIIAFILGLAYFLLRWWKTSDTKRFAIILIPLAFLFLQNIFLGNIWFFSLYIPFLVIILSYGIYKLAIFVNRKFKKFSGILIILLFVFFVYEAFYSINTNVLYRTVGSSPWLYSEHRQENFGYNRLDKYLNNVLADYHGSLFLDYYKDYPQVSSYYARLQEQPLNYLPRGEKQTDVVYIYDPRVDWFAQMWIFERRKIYQQFTMLTVDQFAFLLGNNGFKPFEESGLTKYYFINTTDKVTRDSKLTTAQGDILANYLAEKNIQPIDEIYNNRNEIAFVIYEIPPEVLLK